MPHLRPPPGREPIDVCFMAMGPPQQLEYSISIVRNIEAQSALTTRIMCELLGCAIYLRILNPTHAPSALGITSSSIGLWLCFAAPSVLATHGAMFRCAV